MLRKPVFQVGQRVRSTEIEQDDSFWDQFPWATIRQTVPGEFADLVGEQTLLVQCDDGAQFGISSLTVFAWTLAPGTEKSENIA
jgi:hypothetical protein